MNSGNRSSLSCTAAVPKVPVYTLPTSNLLPRVIGGIRDASLFICLYSLETSVFFSISGSRGDEEESPTALRVDASVEDVVTGDIKDQVPHFVRYKVIKQFKTKSGWSFDFSKTFTDVDPQTVIDKSSMFTEDDSEDTASYELEIELENFTSSKKLVEVITVLARGVC